MVELNPVNEFGFWDKLKYLFSNPNLFFEKVKSEKGIKNALLMYLIVGVFMAGINIVFSITFTGLTYGNYGLGIYSLLTPIYAFGGLAINLVITFLYSGIIHAMMIGFKGEGGYSDSYKAYTYSMVPFLVLSAIPVIGYVSIIYSFILMIIGVSKLHNVSKVKSALACLLPVIFIAGILIFLVVMLLMMFVGSVF